MQQRREPAGSPASSPRRCSDSAHQGRLEHSISAVTPSSAGSLDPQSKDQVRWKRRSLRDFAQSQMTMRDNSEVFSVAFIMSAILVAACCGVAAFSLHLAVQLAGCFGGVNGCHSSILLDQLEPFGISKSLYFIISSALSGLVCSLIMHSSFAGGVAKKCKGGGTAGTKIIISAGRQASSWIAFFRIILAALYLGGGNTLGTEGPIIHLSAALATSLIGLSGTQRRKFLSIFGVIGAAAGISAGFNVLITGFIYTIEELTRTLSRKVALIITLAAAMAIYVKDFLEGLLHHWFHANHVSLVPDREIWKELTQDDIQRCLLLSIPIGILNGIAGWAFARLAYNTQNFLDSVGTRKMCLPARLHLAVIGFITGCLGAIAYEVTGINGVWGTTIGAIPEAISKKNITWDQMLLLFLMKFLSFILATAGGGPGGLLVPSLVAGGFMGVGVGLFAGGGEALISACAVVGMGSLFSSVLHLPVSATIIVFELTSAEALVLHVVIANFISSNVAVRLPSGELSFVHLNLERDPTWLKLGGRDFVETDEHEHAADHTVGHKRLNTMKTIALQDWLMTDHQRLVMCFEAWAGLALKEERRASKTSSQFSGMNDIEISLDLWNRTLMCTQFLQRVWVAWHRECICSLRSLLQTKEMDELMQTLRKKQAALQLESREPPGRVPGCVSPPLNATELD